jgi:hypothetical protein
VKIKKDDSRHLPLATGAAIMALASVAVMIREENCMLKGEDGVTLLA